MNLTDSHQEIITAETSLEGVLARPGATARSAFDRRLGETIRALRRARGLSQECVAIALGVSAQQLQKYERGVNRISVAAFLTLAEVLNVGPDELLAEVAASSRNAARVAPRERMVLLDCYARIPDERLRAQVLLFLSGLSKLAPA